MKKHPLPSSGDTRKTKMEYPIFIIILAIATMCFINFATVMAMEENVAFVLPESGTVISFDNRVSARSSGGLDPPAVESSRGGYASRGVERFEMAESGIMIDFERIGTGYPGTGFSLPSLFDPALPMHTTSSTPAFQAFEMPESGNLIVFPRQVEWRRKQAAQMRSLDGVVSNTH